MTLDIKQESLLARAQAFAAEAHKGQLRRGVIGQPYIVHPIEVANLIAATGYRDEDVLAAAVLHDVVEDCGVTYNQLADLFGARVAGFVLEVTWAPEDTKEDKIRYAPALSYGAGAIKLADLISNVNGLTEDETVMTPDETERYLRYAYRMALAIEPHPLSRPLRSLLLRTLKAKALDLI